MGKQGKGRRLTDKERLEIIALTRQNPRIKHVELAAKYNVNESTIRKWRAQANAAKIEERYAHGVAASRDTRQRGQAVRNAQFDAELYEWVSGMMKQETDLAPARVREKARALAAQYEGMEGFKASSGWFYRFCRRYGLPCGPAGRDTAGAKMHDEMTITAMIPMDVSAHGAEVALMQHAASAPQVSLVATEPHAVTQPSQATELAAASEAAAIALSLQPPAAQSSDEAQPAPESVASVAIPEDTVSVNEAEQKATVPETTTSAPPSAPSHLLLGLGDVGSVAATTTLSTATVVQPTVASVSTKTEAPVALVETTMPAAPAPTPQAFSMAQAAATHMVHHFKDMLDPQTRLRLVRLFTRVAGEAEMYLVMDDETRLEYIKEFAAANANDNATPSPPSDAVAPGAGGANPAS